MFVVVCQLPTVSVDDTVFLNGSLCKRHILRLQKKYFFFLSFIFQEYLRMKTGELSKNYNNNNKYNHVQYGIAHQCYIICTYLIQNKN